MRLWKFLILSISIILICIGSVLIIYHTQIIKQVAYKGMDVKVGRIVGINLDTDAMHFGIVAPKGTSRHRLIISNVYSHNLQIIISWKGNISEMISVSDNNFILMQGENRTVTFSCTLPEDAPMHTTYDGTAKIMYKRFFG